jgi:D-tyrosyl-tRNA(Tyr) deacylase
MRALVQRVRSARVSVDGDVVGEIGAGFVVLVGVAQGDGDTEAQLLAEKTASLRVFEDDAGKMNLSLLDIGGDALVVSQFTLFAECRKGRRPSFGRAAPPLDAERLYELYVEALREAGVTAVETGVFAAKMLVEIANDGPVTIMLDTDELR